jgi:cell division protein FtsI (penicillin-binding protein 3)
LNIGYTDSAKSGYWRVSDLKKNTAALNIPSQLISDKPVIPDVKGMGLKDAVYLLENKGLKTVVAGKGKVVNQSLAAGTTFQKGQKIILMLN